MTTSINLVVATSGRAIAQGLKAIDYPVAVIDGFADQDTVSAAQYCQKIRRDRFGLNEGDVKTAVLSLDEKYKISGLFYDAAVEVNPRLLSLTSKENIVGNTANSLKRCKDPKEFFSALDQHSIAYPNIFDISNVKEQSNCLFKQSHSTGGFGVSLSKHSSIDSNNCYLQEIIQGESFSLTFLANGEHIYVLGANTQWHERLGDLLPYVYAGAINQVVLNDKVIDTAIHYAEIIVKEFDLIGLNSIDYIYDDNDVFVLEVNPRVPASYELYETKNGDLMHEHIHACREKKLPEIQRKPLLRAHAIIYAPYDIHIPSGMSWPLWTADRPHSGEKIDKYEPICSVFSGGKNYSQVCEMIATRKRAVLKKLTI